MREVDRVGAARNFLIATECSRWDVHPMGSEARAREAAGDFNLSTVPALAPVLIAAAPPGEANVARCKGANAEAPNPGK